MADRPPGDQLVVNPEPGWSSDARPTANGVHERIRVERKPNLPSMLERATARDLRARARDRAAQARDRAADQRDRASASADVTAERRDALHAIDDGDLATRAAALRERAAAHRRRAAENRRAAAVERTAAARDREQAAKERLRSREDREALATEIRHQHWLRDEALRQQRRAETLARTLQRTLSPPRLPAICGIDVAVHYEPSAPEEVGGDFYDLFPLAPGRSGFFLGDVVGKGPEAAAVTSLARYTMRTAAMLHERPDQILMDLNAALLMDSEQSMQTCTAVYGEIVIDGDALITLAVAGHVPPLVVRSHGAVEVMAARGTLLGVFDDPEFQSCRVRLGAGDAIVIYSDGILDTEIDGVRLDEDCVAALLTGTVDDSARALVARLLHAVRGNDRPLRDDVAILALRRTPPGELPAT